MLPRLAVFTVPLVLHCAAGFARAQYLEPGITPLLSIPGRSIGDLFGWRVRGLGDADGDGTPDFAVAAPFHQLNLGRVSVHSGSTGAQLWAVDGGQTSAIFGFDLAVLPDFDRDGVREVIAGAPFAGAQGVVVVCSGRTGAVLRTLTPPTGGNAFGVCIAAGGDYDGDGVPDFAIADDANGTTAALRGQVFVYSSATMALVRSIAPPAGGFLFGTTLAYVGDTDGDGRDELAIGDRLATSGPAGRLHLIGFDGSNDVVRWTTGGFHYGSGIDGNKLDGGGDVDGDGAPDVIVDESSLHQARLLSGRTGAVLQTLRGNGADGFGCGAKIVDDQNHDGVPDLLIGARTDSSVAHWNGRVVLLSGRDQRLLRSFTNTTADALLGRDQDLVGDVDRDGFADLLLGASGASGTVRSMGGARIVVGDPLLAGWLTYGGGVAGTLGAPALELDTDPQLGVPLLLALHSSAPSLAPAAFVLGFRAVSLPLPNGGQLLADPAIASAALLPAAGASVPLWFAPTPALLGTQLFAQLLVLDAAAPAGIASSAGLRATLGR